MADEFREQTSREQVLYADLINQQNRALANGSTPLYMTPEQFEAALRAGLQYGSGTQTVTTDTTSVAPARFPVGYQFLSSDIPLTGIQFLVSGPFGAIMALYLRNETDGVYGVYYDDPAHPITVGPEDQRRVEFYTPTDANGRVQSMVLTIVPLMTPSQAETIFVEVE